MSLALLEHLGLRGIGYLDTRIVFFPTRAVPQQTPDDHSPSNVLVRYGSVSSVRQAQTLARTAWSHCGSEPACL